ncbi:Tat (twin-arginine translocation) pathway signal sequence [Mucilaginibacter gossypiicola]|uniref:Tat (Twin-arginine translocation) pathway signal sequence n=1 Tax=Mucilaginibacter gossypiicola TaxID=551995 RepID=A0A1H8P1K0_9SPHI|nr:GDSL-type esterase/lipase family protein [Mucilaginibacter gossypiicola]SEO35790.1 Tat (twin-arginine translocation) pathway signal sequence [Mucilaginibacter gossypiicola]
MSNSRRDFLKKASLAGASAIAAPGLVSASTKNDQYLSDDNTGKTFLFQGDSITDGGRSFDKDWNHVYGQGYAYLITARINFDYPGRDYQFFNRGISGNTVNDLAARWQKDTLDIKPDVLSILIGINDVHRIIMQGAKATAEDFSNAYEQLLTQTITALPNVKLILLEPFILPLGMVSKNPELWATEVQKRQMIVKALASKFNAIFVPLQEVFNKALQKAKADHWIWDGVHPMPAGHELIAREWMKAVKKLY